MSSPADMPTHRTPSPGVQGETAFTDTVTGETGIMLQRADAVFCFHPHNGGVPRPIMEPGRYRSSDPPVQPRRARREHRGRSRGKRVPAR